MKDLITIGITCFREGNLLRRAWQSILDQTNDQWHAVIIIDGGSDYETSKIFDEINHPRLQKFTYQKNVGPYSTKTKAIELATTEWFYFLDGDDSLPANAIDLFYNNHKASAGFYCGQCLLSESGHDRIVNKDNFIIDDILTSFSYPFVVAFKRSVFFQLGGYARELMGGRADFDLILNLLKNNVEYIYVQEVVYQYFLREQSVSKSYPHDIGYKHLVIYRRNKSLFTTENTKNYFLLLGLELSYLYYIKTDNKKLSLLYYRRIKRWVDLRYTLPTYLIYSLPFCFSKRLVLLKSFYRKKFH